MSIESQRFLSLNHGDARPGPAVLPSTISNVAGTSLWIFYYYQTLAPQLPDSFRDMAPLFLAVICGCHAGLFREALHEVYIPRIQRGNDSFAANVLGARGPLLSVLVHFFEHGRWGSLVETAAEGQSLTAEDQLFILMQAGLYLAVTRGTEGRRDEFVTSALSPCVISLIIPGSCV